MYQGEVKMYYREKSRDLNTLGGHRKDLLRL